jgi:hypothetical protein
MVKVYLIDKLTDRLRDEDEGQAAPRPAAQAVRVTEQRGIVPDVRLFRQ